MPKKASPKPARAPAAPVPSTPAALVGHTVSRSIERAEDFVSIYTNDIQVQVSPWDLRLLLGVIVGMPANPPTGSVDVSLLADVRMSPQMAKKIAMILATQVERYEQTFGAIPLPLE